MPITPEAPAAGLMSRRAFDHILIIMFENQYRSYVLANPYMRRLARQGIQLGNSFGVMHPSQTNYIASIAGALCNVTSDGRPAALAERTIVDLIEEAPGRLRWKGYMESYVREATPWTPDFCPQDAPPYFIKHNPFSSFASIVRSEERWRQIDNEAGSVRRPAQRRVPGVCLVHAQHLERRPLDRRHRDRSKAARAGPGRPVGALARGVLPSPALSRAALASAAAHAGRDHLRRVRLRGGLPARSGVAPTTAPTRSTPSCSATASSRPSRRRATTTTACCAPSRRTSASTISARTTPAPTGFSSCGAGASNGARPQATPFDVFDGPLAAAGFAGALVCRLRRRGRHDAPAHAVGRSRALVGRGDAGDRRIGRARDGLDLHGAGAGGALRLRSPAVHEIRSAARMVAGGTAPVEGPVAALALASFAHETTDHARFRASDSGDVADACVRLVRGLGQGRCRCRRPAATAR